MKRFLMIPHAPQVKIRTRTVELAKALALNGVKVDVYSRNTQEPNISLIEKIKWHWQEITSGLRYTEISPNLRQVKVSTMHRVAPLIRLVNWYSGQLLHNLDYDVIITAAYDGLFLKSSQKSCLVYDLVDDHVDGYRMDGKLEIAAQVDKFINRQIASADLIIASSKYLVDLAAKKYEKQVFYIPNGADVENIRNIANQQVKTPSNILSIGYMGGLDDFVKIDLVFHAAEALRNSGINAELTIVGDGPATKNLPNVSWLKLLGFRQPKEIPYIVNTFDIGVVPFALSSFTDAALPLKVIEYGAARCLTVSSPLKELQMQGFPWVELVPLEVESWVMAFKKMSSIQWDLCWDSIVDRFDWKIIANQLLKEVSNVTSVTPGKK